LRWQPEGLLLRQTFTKPPLPPDRAALFKAALPWAPRDSSNVLLRWNGEVTAQISELDARTGRGAEPAVAELRKKAETQVAAAVTQAWLDFRQGDLAAADRALGEKPDSEIFYVPPNRAAAMRWRQASLGLVVLLFLGMMLVGQYPQILKALIGSRAKPVPPAARTTNSAARAHNTALAVTNASPPTGFSGASNLEQPTVSVPSPNP